MSRLHTHTSLVSLAHPIKNSPYEYKHLNYKITVRENTKTPNAFVIVKETLHIDFWAQVHKRQNRFDRLKLAGIFQYLKKDTIRLELLIIIYSTNHDNQKFVNAAML